MHAPGASAPFRLKGIEHVLLLVDGLERSIAFYQDVIGARIERELPNYAMAELRAGHAHIDLVDISAPAGAWALPPVAGGRNVDHVGLELEPCDEAALRRHLAAQNVEIVEERIENRPEGRRLSLYVRDPSGNVIELMGESS